MTRVGVKEQEINEEIYKYNFIEKKEYEQIIKQYKYINKETKTKVEYFDSHEHANKILGDDIDKYEFVEVIEKNKIIRLFKKDDKLKKFFIYGIDANRIDKNKYICTGIEKYNFQKYYDEVIEEINKTDEYKNKINYYMEKLGFEEGKKNTNFKINVVKSEEYKIYLFLLLSSILELFNYDIIRDIFKNTQDIKIPEKLTPELCLEIDIILNEKFIKMDSNQKKIYEEQKLNEYMNCKKELLYCKAYIMLLKITYKLFPDLSTTKTRIHKKNFYGEKIDTILYIPNHPQNKFNEICKFLLFKQKFIFTDE